MSELILLSPKRNHRKVLDPQFYILRKITRMQPYVVHLRLKL